MRDAMLAAKAKHTSALEAANPKPSTEAMDMETKDHLRKLTDAFDIMADPAKMKRVHALAGRHHNAIKSLGDLKNIRDAFEAHQNKEPDADEA